MKTFGGKTIVLYIACMNFQSVHHYYYYHMNQPHGFGNGDVLLTN